MNVVFGDNISLGSGKYGNAVLSRFPIKSHENLKLPNHEQGEQRGVLKCMIDIPASSEELCFLATHFDHRRDETERLASAAMLNQTASQRDSGLMLLAGDLNATPGSKTLKQLSEYWKVANADELPTVPVHQPARQIDYVLFRPAKRWQVIEVRVLPEAVASDHRAVLAVLKVSGE